MGKKTKRKPPQRYRPPLQQQQQQQQQQEEQKQQSVEPLPGESINSALVVDPDQKENAADHGDEEPLKCRHFRRGVNLEKLAEKLESLTAVPHFCPTCNKEKKLPKHASGKKKKQFRKKNLELPGSEDTVWICLACGYVGCEKSGEGDEEVRRMFGTGHAIEHFRRERHPFVLQCGDGLSIWCLDCGYALVTPDEAVNGFESLGHKGKVLQEAVKLIQESYMKKAGVKNRGYELVPADDSPVEKSGVVRGLMNLGNTCFFNSVMQNLLALRLLKDHFLRSEPKNEGPLTSALRKCFEEFNFEPVDQESSTKRRFRDGGTYNPKSLFGAVCAKASRFSGYQQQDSHELLRCLLDGLEEEGSKCNQQVQHVETFVNRLFGGQFASTVRCCECGYSSSVLESFLDVSLPIPVAEGGKTTGAQSKRELKAKKSMDRKKTTPPFKPSSEAVAEKNHVKEQAAACSSSVMEDVSWLDYVRDDDFVDVSLDGGSSAYDEPLLQVVAVGDSITAQADSGPTLEVATAAATEERVAELGDSAVPVSVESSVSEVDVSQDTQGSTSVEGDVQPLTASDEVDCSASAPPVIALPWGDYEPSQTGWEIVPAENESDGLANLFQEEETSVVVGCANKDEAAAYEEPEDIVEKCIIPMTLEGCLLAFTKLEVLSGENAWGCDNCSKKDEEVTVKDTPVAETGADEARTDNDSELSKEAVTEDDSRRPERGKRRKPPKVSDERAVSSVKRNATKSLVIKKAPPVLTVHLKRFAQDMRGKLSKLTGHVAFDEMLNLNQFRGTRDADEVCMYRLVGVVEHSGTMRGGHYVAFVRSDAEDGKKSFWYYISDSDVRMTTLDNVLRSEAYLLFYEKV